MASNSTIQLVERANDVYEYSAFRCSNRSIIKPPVIPILNLAIPDNFLVIFDSHFQCSDDEDVDLRPTVGPLCPNRKHALRHC